MSTSDFIEFILNLISLTIKYTGPYSSAGKFQKTSAMFLLSQGPVKHLAATLKMTNTDQDNSNIPAMKISGLGTRGQDCIWLFTSARPQDAINRRFD